MCKGSIANSSVVSVALTVLVAKEVLYMSTTRYFLPFMFDLKILMMNRVLFELASYMKIHNSTFLGQFAGFLWMNRLIIWLILLHRGHMLLVRHTSKLSNCLMTTNYILNGQLKVSDWHVSWDFCDVSDRLAEISLPPKVAHGSIRLLNPSTWKVIDR